MRRLLLGLVAVAALAACSDSPVTGTVSPTVRLGQSVPAENALDQSIYDLIAGWPKGQADAILDQWIKVKRKYEAGDLVTTNQKLVELASYVLKKVEEMNEPASETKNAAAARLISYMALYVGGGTVAPPAGTDNAAGVLTPGVPLTLVTPSGHAGTQFEGDETAESRIIVITQNATPYSNCAGPLPTTRCQYPLFYHIESIPAGPLLAGKPGVADICLSPHPRNHDDLRLAHTKPGDPNDIEELNQASTPKFIDCSNIGQEVGDASLFGRAVRLAGAVGSRVGKLLTPQSAYAVDQGGGGEFGDFSPFNWVGPTSVPDPIIALTGTENYSTGPAGEEVFYTRYNIPVTNWASYPASMFVASPQLPPCGQNTSASRTWVEIYNGDTNNQVYGFCALGTPSDLQYIWVAFPTNSTHPCSLYIKLWDRLTDVRYTSNTISTGCPIVR